MSNALDNQQAELREAEAVDRLAKKHSNGLKLIGFGAGFVGVGYAGYIGHKITKEIPAYLRRENLTARLEEAQNNASFGQPTKIQTDTSYINNRNESVTSVTKFVDSKKLIAQTTHELNEINDPGYTESMPGNIFLPLGLALLTFSGFLKAKKELTGFNDKIADITSGWHLALKEKFAKKPDGINNQGPV